MKIAVNIFDIEQTNIQAIADFALVNALNMSLVQIINQITFYFDEFHLNWHTLKFIMENVAHDLSWPSTYCVHWIQVE